jgi:asparagine synthase (glutamine-hydrolysing)
VLARRVVEWWRQDPDALAALRATDFVKEQWLEEMLSGGVEPRPSSVGFLTNVVVAAGGAWRSPGARAV